jgi:hypothetical protein
LRNHKRLLPDALRAAGGKTLVILNDEYAQIRIALLLSIQPRSTQRQARDVAGSAMATELRRQFRSWASTECCET